MKVPLLDLKAQYAQIQNEVEAATIKALRDTKYILGPDVGELECALAGYIGAKHVVGCASGSDSLLLALMALNVGVGDEVITTPHTFFATAGAITRLGAKPVFVDIDLRSYNIDAGQAASKVTQRTKAIIPVHLFGQSADLDPLLKLGIPVIEDGAQAIGSTYKNRKVGTWGAMGTFSFFPSKNLGGAGDGGAISTNDDTIAEKLRVLRVHGSKPKYYHSLIGINSRLDTLQAAILKVKLNYLNGWTEARQRNAAHYDRRFRELGIEKLVNPPWRDPNCNHIFNQYTLRVARRDALREHLQKYEIGTEIYYPVPLHLQQCFAYLGHKTGDFPNSERAATESLALPIYPELTPTQLDFVAETVAAFVKT